MAAPPTGAELTTSTTTIDDLSDDLLTEVLLRVPTPAALVHASAVSRRWRRAIAAPASTRSRGRGAIATPDPKSFVASYRELHRSGPLLGLYVPRQISGNPTFLMPEKICSGDTDRDLKHAVNKAAAYNEIHRHQDHRLHDDGATDLGPLEGHSGCRLLLTRGDEALEVRSPLARESILLPFPPDADLDGLEPRLLQGHGEAAAAFRVVYLQHRCEGRNRLVRAMEYDSTRKTCPEHPWHTIKDHIEGPPEEVMHAGHRMFCRYRGRWQAALMLDTRKMEFSVLPLPTDLNFAIGEIEDSVCCLVEAVDRNLFKVWKLEEEKLEWKLEKEILLDQVLAKHDQYLVGYHRPRAISSGIALVCSTTQSHHFVLDLNTCTLMDMFEFHGRSAYIMQMPWPPAFSLPTDAREFDRDGEPASVGNSGTVAGELDEIEGLLGGAPALAEEPTQVDTCPRPEPSPSPSLGCGFSTEPVLSTGQVHAVFTVPKPNANMTEASEGAERMHKDGMNQESEVDGQKQDKESPPTRRANDAKERKRERDRARWHAMSQEKRERERERDRARWHAMSEEQRKRRRERDRTRWHAMSQEINKRRREAYMIKQKQQANIKNINAMSPGSSKQNQHELRDGAAAL